jgi:hypothetical protein
METLDMQTLNVKGQAQKVNYGNFQITLCFRQSGLVDVNVNVASLAKNAKRLHCFITPARHYSIIDIDFIRNITDKQILLLLRSIAKIYLNKVEDKPISFLIRKELIRKEHGELYYEGAIYLYLSGYKIFLKKYFYNKHKDMFIKLGETLESEFYLHR